MGQPDRGVLTAESKKPGINGAGQTGPCIVLVPKAGLDGAAQVRTSMRFDMVPKAGLEPARA